MAPKQKKTTLGKAKGKTKSSPPPATVDLGVFKAPDFGLLKLPANPLRAIVEPAQRLKKQLGPNHLELQRQFTERARVKAEEDRRREPERAAELAKMEKAREIIFAAIRRDGKVAPPWAEPLLRSMRPQPVEALPASEAADTAAPVAPATPQPGAPAHPVKGKTCTTFVGEDCLRRIVENEQRQASGAPLEQWSSCTDLARAIIKTAVAAGLPEYKLATVRNRIYGRYWLLLKK